MPAPGPTDGAAGHPNHRIWLLAPALLFLLSMFATQPAFLGDTFFYVAQIIRVRLGILPVTTLWESGHILWRPLGYLASPVFLNLIPGWLAWTPELRMGAGLIFFNLAGGLAGTILIYDLSRRFLRSPWPALLPALLFVWADGVLSYSRSGTSYVPGLALLTAGLWWQLTAQKSRVGTIIGPACLFALAALVWLPYVLVLPAACCARKFVRLPDTKREPFAWKHVLLGMVVSGVVLVPAVALGALLGGVRSAPGFAAWMTASGHELHQDRQLIRAVSGCARLFLELSADGIYLKRFAFHDPYFPVTASGLIRHSLAKIGFFYVFVASAIVLAWQAKTSRLTLVPLLLAGVPSLFFAVVVFEPSSPERFLPVLPFLLITVAAGLSCVSKPATLLRGAVYLFAILLPLMNLSAFEPKFSGAYRNALAQLTLIRQNAAPGDILATVTMSEPLVQFPNDHPFDNSNRAGTFQTYWVIDTRAADAVRWPARFAHMALEAWDGGHNIWVEKAALAPRPMERLAWTEGDNQDVPWRNVPVFFRSLEYDIDIGGANGFLRLSGSPANRAHLRAVASR